MKLSVLCRFFGLALFCLGAGWAAQASASCREGISFALSIHEDLVSLNSENACLGAILEELGSRSYIKIHIPKSLAEIPISASFQKVPLREGISLILRDINYALYMETRAGSSVQDPFPGRNRGELSLLHKNSKSNAPTRFHSKEFLYEDENDAANLAALAEYARSLPNPEMRAYAVQLMAQTNDVARVTQMLFLDLVDPDPQIRRSALSAMIDIDPQVAERIDHLVANIALHDKNTELRKQALLKLVDDNFPSEKTAFVMKEARYDSDPDIKKLARKLSILLEQPAE